MDTKVTLSFNKEIVNEAKKFASDNNISLSRLIEFLLSKVTSKTYQSLEDFPISEWVSQVAEGEAVYHTKRNRKASKAEFFASKK
jgi:hypothetical protein